MRRRVYFHLLLVVLSLMVLVIPVSAQDVDWGGPDANCEGVTLTRIGYSPLTMEFDYFQFIQRGMQQIAEQCGVEVVTADPGVDAAQQVADVENMVAGGVGSVAIYSVDPTAILTAVDTASAAGVTVIAAVSAFEDADVYVGISDYEFGYLQGLQAGPVLLERKPGEEMYQIAVLNADSLGPNLLDRKQGLIDGLSQTVTNFEVVADVEAWAEDTALAAVETILQANPDLDLILTVNDPGSLGAASAVESAGIDLQTGTIVMGLGIDRRVLEGVLDGTFPGSVSPEPIATGRALANVAFALNRGEAVPTNVIVPVIEITADNAQQFIDELYESGAETTEVNWGGAEANCADVSLTRVGYSPLTMEFDYFQFIQRGMQQIAEQCGVEVVTADPGVDAAQQVADVENMVAGGVGSVAIYSVDPTAILTAVDTAAAAGVTVIAAVSAFEDADVYVGISDYEFGYLQGLQAGPVLLERKPGEEMYQIAVLNADSLGPNLLDRKQGLIDGLSQTVTNFEVVADVEAWAEDTALAAVETILQGNPGLDLILTVNDPGSLGAASAVEAAGVDLQAGTIVMGLGIDRRVLEGVLDGTFPGSVSPEPIATGRALANVAFALNRGEAVPTNVIVPVIEITADNAQQFIDELYAN
jgi:ABC-type sugar transport system substrate-binding protein